MEAKHPFLAEISLLAHKWLQFCLLQKKRKNSRSCSQQGIQYSTMQYSLKESLFYKEKHGYFFKHIRGSIQKLQSLFYRNVKICTFRDLPIQRPVSQFTPAYENTLRTTRYSYGFLTTFKLHIRLALLNPSTCITNA